MWIYASIKNTGGIFIRFKYLVEVLYKIIFYSKFYSNLSIFLKSCIRHIILINPNFGIH